MIKVEVIENFTLERFDELKNIKRTAIEEKGKLFFGDSFECTKEMCDYLLGNNPKGKTVVKVIEVVPEVKEETEKVKTEVNIDGKKVLEKIIEIQDKPKTSKKKKSSKK